jgi:hypothetical protein
LIVGGFEVAFDLFGGDLPVALPLAIELAVGPSRSNFPPSSEIKKIDISVPITEETTSFVQSNRERSNNSSLPAKATDS